ncbi:hypothetical protein CN507_17830 [Bacillus cereus]|nr:hypothetical protein CN507_17830 [Bacillus cereus]
MKRLEFGLGNMAGYKKQDINDVFEDLQEEEIVLLPCYEHVIAADVTVGIWQQGNNSNVSAPEN